LNGSTNGELNVILLKINNILKICYSWYANVHVFASIWRNLVK